MPQDAERYAIYDLSNIHSTLSHLSRQRSFALNALQPERILFISLMPSLTGHMECRPANLSFSCVEDSRLECPCEPREGKGRCVSVTRVVGIASGVELGQHATTAANKQRHRRVRHDPVRRLRLQLRRAGQLGAGALGQGITAAGQEQPHYPLSLSAATIAATKPCASGVSATASTRHPSALNAAAVVSPIAATRALPPFPARRS